MRAFILGAAVVGFAAAGLAVAPQTPAGGPDEAVERSRTAVAGLGERLKALLGKEMRRGGYAGAVEACSTSAQKVTAEFAEREGVDIRRVSLKYRNTADKPDEWERRVLERWEADMKAGKALPGEVVETRSEGGRRVQRYLKPITIQAMCLGCHGRAGSLGPGVAEVLRRAYPEDRATGYAAGDLRGAFSVKMPARR